jgi:hypothetical protein
VSEDGFDTPEDAIEAWEDEHGVELDQEQFEYLADQLEASVEANGEASVAEIVSQWQQEQAAPSEQEQWTVAEIQFINNQLADYERQTGRQFTAQEIQRLGDLALVNREPDGLPGIGRLLAEYDELAVAEEQAAVEADEQAGVDAWDVSIDNGCQRLEQKLGRPLLNLERLVDVDVEDFGLTRKLHAGLLHLRHERVAEGPKPLL